MNEEGSRLWRLVLNSRVALVAGGLLLCGIIAFAFGVRQPIGTARHEVWVDIGLAVVIPAAVTVVFALWTGRWLIKEVEARCRLSAGLLRSGVTSYTSFDKVDWRDHFSGALTLEAYVAWGVGWARNICSTQLKALVGQPGASLTVVLPDPSNSGVVEALTNQFKKRDANYVRGHIEEAIEFYSVELLRSAHQEATIEVYGMAFVPFFSCYVFNSQKAVVALMPHTSDRVEHLPTLLVGKGECLDFVRRDVAYVKTQKDCRLIFSTKPGDGSSS